MVRAGLQRVQLAQDVARRASGNGQVWLVDPVLARRVRLGLGAAPTSRSSDARAQTGDPARAWRAFHGYLFRMLTSQEPHARGGARDYIVDGKMTGGFAILAYPIEYGASGVMSFLISSRGTVCEKDLGESSAETAKGMRAFDPDPSWRVLK